jgi:hypothetical protein
MLKLGYTNFWEMEELPLLYIRPRKTRRNGGKK